MKTLLAAAVSLSLIAGAVTPAYADNRDHDRQQWRNDDRHHDGRHDDRNDHDRNRGHDNDRRDYRSGYIEGRRDQHRYDAGRYVVPRGYQARSWHRGDRLPPAYYSSRYVINDYRAYRLYAPSRGQHWVRVNNDVLLTAVATGAVIAVVSGLFH
ncbi:MAG: RcnB family protein [Steroidobacteraceae bacterium]